MKTKWITYAVLVILFSSNITFSQWIKTGGPIGGEIKCMTISNNNIYIGTHYGLYKSTNRGSNWSPISAIHYEVRSITSKGDTIFAGTFINGLFKSTNAGNNWTFIDLPGGTITSLFIYGNKLFAYAAGAGLLYSTNTGTSWILSSLETNSLYVCSYAVLNNTIFVGTPGQGVYLSSNEGLNWSQCNNGFNQLSAYTLETNDNYVFAGMYGDGIYRSSNNGANWESCNIGLGYLHGIYYIHNKNGVLFASVYGDGIYRSTDNGEWWDLVSDGFDNEKNISTIKSLGDTLYAGTFGNGMFTSVNNGQNWVQIDNGLSIQEIRSFITKDNYIFAGTSYAGIFRSSNEGNTWQKVNNGFLYYFYVNAFAYLTGNNLLAGYEDGVYETGDFGEEWFSLGRPAPNGMVRCILFHNNIIYTGNDNSSGIYASSNYGSSWNYVGLVNRDINCIMFKDNVLIAGTEDFSGNNYGIYISTNNGAIWNGTMPGQVVKCLVQNSNNIFAGTIFGTVGVYKSTNNGQTWALCGLSNHSINSLINVNSNIFAGASDGIYLSTNDGSIWSNVTDNLTSVRISSLCNYNDYLYAGTYGNSIWKRPLNELIGIKNLSNKIPSSFKLEQNYPNPFNPSTKIRFSIPPYQVVDPANAKQMREGQRDALTVLTIYDILGKEITTLVNQQLHAGTFEVEWDASDYPSGVYFYTLAAGSYRETKRMVMLK